MVAIVGSAKSETVAAVQTFLQKTSSVAQLGVRKCVCMCECMCMHVHISMSIKVAIATSTAVMAEDGQHKVVVVVVEGAVVVV